MQVSLWKVLLVVAAIVCGRGAAFGQELHLKARNVYTGPPIRGRAETRVRVRRAETAHRIVQFDHLPGVDDLDALLEAGFRIVAAIPDNAVVVFAPPGTPVTPQISGVRWLGELDAADKLSPALSQEANPIQAMVEFHADVEMGIQQSIAAAEGLTFAPCHASVKPRHRKRFHGQPARSRRA